MANQVYGQRGVSSLYSTTSRSGIDNYLSDHSLVASSSSRYIPTSYVDHHQPLSPSSLYPSLADPTPSLLPTSASRSVAGSSSLWSPFHLSSRTMPATATSTALWSTFDVSATLSKRPSEAMYGAHMIGQSEAWLTSDTLAKRPRLENASDLPIYPQRPGEKDCAHYMLTRTCKFGDNCKFDHPIWVPLGGIPDWKEPPAIPFDSHPERPGEPDCPYFLKTQKCKFGMNCKFNHPKDLQETSDKTTSDLPERPSEPPCSFYMKTGKCKFGAACKFHHPRDIEIPSSGQEMSKVEQTNSVENVGASTTIDVSTAQMTAFSPALSYNSKGLPIRTGETDCPFYMKTGSCKYGANCRYNHPDWNVINPPAAAIGQALLSSPVASLNIGLFNPSASILHNLHPRSGQAMLGLGPSIYPLRPGQIECDYYMKTGECKFGENCKFHHPVDRFEKPKKQTQEQNVKLTLAGLPRREGVQHCPFYMKTGTCGYGVSCRFDHPLPGEVMASTVAGKEASASGVEDGKQVIPNPKD